MIKFYNQKVFLWKLIIIILTYTKIVSLKRIANILYFKLICFYDAESLNLLRNQKFRKILLKSSMHNCDNILM